MEMSLASEAVEQALFASVVVLVERTQLMHARLYYVTGTVQSPEDTGCVNSPAFGKLHVHANC